MDSTPLIDALVIGGSLAALIASILAIYMVTLSLRVYRLSLTAYTNIRDALMQMAIQAAEKTVEQAAKQTPREELATVEEHRTQPEKTEVETRKEPYGLLSELVAGEGFEAALIFDDSGQVIDQEGAIDSNREAALLTEVINSLQLARSSVKSLQIQEDSIVELLIPSADVAGRRVYLYVKASKGVAGVDVELLSESAKRILKNLLSGG
ncbi:hypothetical protein HRbin02_00195 [Candidatus Calditenuaceae archaeon HR02]|nr:hypothetical protein HRbin02_00195 [Candidatus Calditenuaceae archaeon HR02]